MKPEVIRHHFRFLIYLLRSYILDLFLRYVHYELSGDDMMLYIWGETLSKMNIPFMRKPTMCFFRYTKILHIAGFYLSFISHIHSIISSLSFCIWILSPSSDVNL